MSFKYKPPKKKKNNVDLKKIFDTVLLLSPFPTIQKGRSAVKQYKKIRTKMKAAKIGQTIGPAGGPTSITKPKPRPRPPITKTNPRYEYPIDTSPFPFKRNK